MVVEEFVVGREPEDSKKYGKLGTIFIGKHIVGSGFEYHLTNPVLMDIARPHIVLILGKRGFGKCLEENTLITLDNGSVVPIKELENNDNEVFGLDDKLKIRTLKKEGFFAREVSELMHLKLRSGREIKLTLEHPLLTINGWKQSKELSIGSRIAVPRKIEVFGNKEIEECKIKLLAYLIAEGHLSNGFVLFSNKEEEMINDFSNAVMSFDSNLKIELHSKDGCYRVSKSRREVDKSKMRLNLNKKGNFDKGTYTPQKKSSIHNWLNEIKIYGKLSKEKFIPDLIFQLPKSQLSLFLNILFSCDGCIYKRKDGYWEISYSTESEKLIHQIQHLLLRFGILSKIRKKRTKINNKEIESFELTINSINMVSFIEEIGFFGEKIKFQEQCLKEVKDIKRNPNLDTIPKEIWDIYRPNNWAEAGKAFSYKTPKALRSSIAYGPSREKLLQIAEVDGNEFIKLLAESDVFWDEIISMELLEDKFRVYDMEIPKFHNFVANDVIVHNSYSAGVIAEEILKLPQEIKENLTCLLIDTAGIYWTMKNPNDIDLELLSEWSLRPQSFPIHNIVPVGLTDFYETQGIAYDGTFSIKPSELSTADWALTFNLSIFDPLGILLERTLKKLHGRDYSIQDMVDAIEADERADPKERLALENRFLAAEGWGIFSTKATPIENFLQPGTVTVLDVSLQEWSIRNLMLGILAREIYEYRVAARRLEELAIMGGEEIEKKVPLTWIMIDEIHEFLPAKGETSATQDLLTIIRQGRQPGISLVLMTQRPNKLHYDAVSQADLIISHRLTSRNDLEALSGIMQTYLITDIRKSLEELPKVKGASIILDDNSERLFSVQIHPRQSWHGGGSPIALKEKKAAYI